MSAIDDFLQRNRIYAEEFDGPALPPAPASRVVVVCCMDARINLMAVLGLDAGDAHVLRNAGGVVTEDVIRSLLISQRMLGTREIMVIQHTGCGLMTFTDAELKDAVEGDTGVRPEFGIGTFDQLEDSVRESLRRLAASPFLPHGDAARGFIYEIETGRLVEVERSD